MSGWYLFEGFFAKRSTPAERLVIAWTLILFGVFGGLAFLHFVLAGAGH